MLRKFNLLDLKGCKYNLFLFVIFFLSHTKYGYSQNYLRYYEEINKAEINNLEFNYAKSDSIYRLAFSLVNKPFKEDYYLAAINADRMNNSIQVYEYLIEAVKKGLLLKRIKKQKFKYFKSSKYFKKIKKSYDSIHKIYIESVDENLSSEISKMIYLDQKYRKSIIGNSKKMMTTDSINFTKLLDIIKNNNNKWPGFSTIGEISPKGKYNVSGNIALLILHFKKNEVEILKPFMLEAVQNGEMYPYQYARIIDYTISIPTKSCQIYGTYLDGGYLINICDCKKAAIERNKVGFEPIEDYYRKRNSGYKCSQ